MKDNLLSINSEIIFVDFFDTLVHRTIYPEHTKKIWAKQLQEYHNDLYLLRNTIEGKLCELNQIDHGALDFHYDDMCYELYSQLNPEIDFEAFKVELSTCEIEIEKNIQFPNYALIKQLRGIKKQKKIAIYCVSDFYFTKEMMWELIKHHGFDDFIDDLFVSAEYRVTKSSGLLYPRVIQTLGIQDKEIIMIGDNIHSDVKMAKQNGLKAIHCDSSNHHAFYKSINTATNAKDHIASILGHIELFKDFLFPEILLSLYLFMTKLHGYIEKEQLKNIYFLSREGEFLKKLYDKYIEYHPHSLEVKTYYCYVSRKSTFMPSLDAFQDESFERLFRQYRNISIYEFLISCGFLDIEIETIASSFSNINFNTRLDDLSTSSEFQSLKKSILFGDIFNKKRIDQKLNFTNYLKSIDFFETTPLLIDVGWKGTIQDNISATFKDHDIIGCYLGLTDFASASIKNKKIGLLFEPEHCFNISHQQSIFNECRALFEVFLGASHGSTVQYDDDGKPSVENNKQELELFKSKIFPLQAEAFELFDFLCKHMYNHQFTDEELTDEISERYAFFVFNPTKKQVDFFSSLTHYENFGVCEYSTFADHSKNNNYINITNFLKFVKSPKSYMKGAWWKGAKFKTDGLSIFAPIYQAYRMKKLGL